MEYSTEAYIYSIFIYIICYIKLSFYSGSYKNNIPRSKYEICTCSKAGVFLRTPWLILIHIIAILFLKKMLTKQHSSHFLWIPPSPPYICRPPEKEIHFCLGYDRDVSRIDSYNAVLLGCHEVGNPDNKDCKRVGWDDEEIRGAFDWVFVRGEQKAVVLNNVTINKKNTIKLSKWCNLQRQNHGSPQVANLKTQLIELE